MTTQTVIPGTIFRHYKNQFYKVLGTARHSETLEDLVLYECLYPNPAGQIWVRPKDNFFGTVTLENYHGPRFQITDRVE